MKKGLEKPIDSLGETPTKDKTKYSRWQPVCRLCLLSVDQAGRPPTVEFSTTGKAVDQTVDRSSQTESDHSLSVDRTGRPEQTESSALSVGRPERSTDVHNAHWCMSVDRPGRPTEQFCSASGRPCGRPYKANLQFWKTFWSVKFFDKFSLDG